MPAATPTRAMSWSAALQKRGFQVAGPSSIISPNGTAFASQEEAWAYVEEVEAGAARLLTLWRADHLSPAEEAQDAVPRANGRGAGRLG